MPDTELFSISLGKATRIAVRRATGDLQYIPDALEIGPQELPLPEILPQESLSKDKETTGDAYGPNSKYAAWLFYSEPDGYMDYLQRYFPCKLRLSRRIPVIEALIEHGDYTIDDLANRCLTNRSKPHATRIANAYKRLQEFYQANPDISRMDLLRKYMGDKFDNPKDISTFYHPGDVGAFYYLIHKQRRSITEITKQEESAKDLRRTFGVPD